MRPRFYLPALDETGRGTLGADEAAHLTRVLRLGVGAEVDVFDGRGGMFLARVVELGRAGAQVQVLGPAPSAPEARLAVTLVISVLKGDKMDDVVRDAAMMGAGAVQPVVSARSEMSLAALLRGHRAERWQRIAVASVKQCGRAVVPVVRAPRELRAWAVQPGGDPVLVLYEPSAGIASRLGDVPSEPAVQLLVGPEGGWAEEERASFETARFRAVSLGRRTLRAEAAPLVAMAAIYEAWNGW